MLRHPNGAYRASWGIPGGLGMPETRQAILASSPARVLGRTWANPWPLERRPEAAKPRGAAAVPARVAVRPGGCPDADDWLLWPAAPPATRTVRPGVGETAARIVASRLAQVLGQRRRTAPAVRGVSRAELARLPPDGPGATLPTVLAVGETAATGHGLRAICHAGHAADRGHAVSANSANVRTYARSPSPPLATCHTLGRIGSRSLQADGYRTRKGSPSRLRGQGG
jgi:hypothetical protein